jgi:hypothetical protein
MNTFVATWRQAAKACLCSDKKLPLDTRWRLLTGENPYLEVSIKVGTTRA